MRKFLPLFVLVFLAIPRVSYAQWSITALNTNLTQNFDGMSTGTTLPAGFQIITPRSAAIGFVDFSTNSYGSTATGAAYNTGYGNNPADRSIGILNSGSYGSGKYILLQITNNTGSTINSITISWNYEKYRSGNRDWNWTFYHGASSPGSINAAAGNQSYPSDGTNATAYNPPPTVAKSVTITGLNIPAGTSYFFRWLLTAGGDSNGQGLSIDDVVINCATSTPVCPPGTPMVALGNDTAYCQGSPFSLTLNAQNAGATYDWNNGASTSQTFTVTTAGTYMVKVTDSNGCIDRDTLVVTQKTRPTVQLGNDTAYCAGSAFSLPLNAQNAGATYLWNNSTSAQTLTATAAGTYWATVTAPNGCAKTDTLHVTQNALPTVQLGNDTAYCAGSPFSRILDAQNAGAGYNWNSGAATTQTYTADTAGTYTVTVTDAHGCQNTDNVTVTEYALPIVNIGNDTAYCAGTPFLLTLNAHNPGASYNWNNGMAPTQQLQVSTAGINTVIVTDSHGCQNTDTLTITEYTLPPVNIGPDTAYCAGSTFNLLMDAQNSGATYNWNNGTANTQTYTATAAGIYAVTVTDANGCQNIDVLTVTQNPLPVVNIGNDTSYCIGNTFSLLLDAENPGASYSWNGGGLNAQVFSVTQAGVYSVVVTNGFGCSDSASVTVTENPLPTVDIEDNTFYCAGTPFSLLLDAGNPGASYSWNGGTSTGQTFTASTAGNYHVVVTDANGCSNSDSTLIEEKPLPTVELGNDTAYCASGNFSLLLNAQNPGASYSWNGGVATTQTYAVTQAGTYTVNVTDVYGCSNSGSLTITENALPTLDLGSDVTTTQTSTVLSAGSGFTDYLWFPGGQTVPQITVNQTGNYSVTVTNANGCSTSDTVHVTVGTAFISETGPTAASIRIYPNPADEKLTVSLDYPGILQLDLISVTGKLMWSHKITPYETGQTVEVDLAPFAAGVYMLRFTGAHFGGSNTVIIAHGH